MYISRQLKEKNIAEYLLYMWQVEDLIRANGLDIDKISQTIISQYQISEEQKEALKQWYENLIDMMRQEGVVQTGHLQINKNILINLTELHHKLVNSSKFPFYRGAYYKALPFIVELRNKNSQKDELETCFQALYGVMMLKLNKKTISEETLKAMETITGFLSLLANYYDKERKGELDIE